ncbi:MAG: SulP family inorganic anion transporter [Bacteroidota bacterium]
MTTNTTYFNFSTLRADFFGGLSGAVAVLPQTIGLSVLLFTALGLDASSGAMAGLIGAIILLLVSGFMGATIGMISAPNGPVTILLAGLAADLVSDYTPHEMLIIIGAVLFLTGIFQIIFGLLRGGEIIKLIPFPVVASMITAIGILMMGSQVKQLMPSEAIDGWQRYIPLLVALITVISIFLFKKLFPRLPSILMGLLAGIIFYSALTLSMTNTPSDWVIGTLPALDLSAISQRFDGIDINQLPWELIFFSSLALTVLVTIDCLLTALVADAQTSKRHNTRNELVAQGGAQMLIGLVGGVGGGGTKGSTLANIMAGGRRWSPVFAALLIIIMIVFGRELGSFLPLSALSGVIIFIGLNMINLNILLWLKDKYTRIDAVNAIMVIMVTLFFDVTKAVGLGMVFAVITFIRRSMQRSLIRRETNVSEYPSPRKRNEKHRKILEEQGDKALLIELQGNLYFAKTDKLYGIIMEKLKERQVIILHFRRVTAIDMSGMVLLMQLVEAAKKNGTKVVFTHLHKRLGFGKKMKKAFSLIEKHKKYKKKSITKIFHSTAHALEYAEEKILKNELKSKEYRVSLSVDFEGNDLFKAISEEEVSFLKKISERKDYKRKDIILAEGDESASLYLVTNGFVEQRLYNGPISFKVLAKYSPGTYFGELTFFNKEKISTRFVAQGKTALYKLKRSDIEHESTQVGNKCFADLLLAIGGQLSKRSRNMILEIKRLEAL